MSPTCCRSSAPSPASRPRPLAERYAQYGPLKADTADAVVEALRPVRERYAELAADPTAADAILAKGAEKASTIAAATMTRVRRSLGLVTPG